MLAYFTAALLAAQLAIDAAPPAAPLRVRVSDPAVIRTAVKAALAASPAPARDTGRILSGDAQSGLSQAFDEARVPGCLNPDALKHQPAKIGFIDLSGILVVPFWLAAVARGKCQ